MLEHLLRRAVAETYRARLAGLDLRPLQERFDGGLTVETGDTVSARRAARRSSARCPAWPALLERLEPDGIGEGPAAVGIAAAVVEFALEGLYLNKRLAKDSDGDRDGLRCLTAGATATARGTAAPIRWSRRTTSARRWTRSATTCSPACRRAVR